MSLDSHAAVLHSFTLGMRHIVRRWRLSLPDMGSHCFRCAFTSELHPSKRACWAAHQSLVAPKRGQLAQEGS